MAMSFHRKIKVAAYVLAAAIGAMGCSTERLKRTRTHTKSERMGELESHSLDKTMNNSYLIWCCFLFFPLIASCDFRNNENRLDLSRIFTNERKLDLRQKFAYQQVICLSSNTDYGIDSMGDIPRFSGNIDMRNIPSTKSNSILILTYKSNKLNYIEGVFEDSKGMNIVTRYARKRIVAYKQCSDAASAVAECVDIAGRDSGCIFLFPSSS
jgi:hypothetical protein